MNWNRLSLIACAGGSLILSSGGAEAAYTHIYLEHADNFFSSHPNKAVRDAWNAGPVNQYEVYRLYANFNSNTAADRVNAVAGSPGTPLIISVDVGTFHNYTENVGGDVVHFNKAFTGATPVERNWDTYVTIGDAIDGGNTGVTPGLDVETNNLGYNSSVIGPSAGVAWFIMPQDTQGQAVAAAPGQADAPSGTYRVFLAQFTVTQGSTVTGNCLINVNGIDHLNQVIQPGVVPGDANGDGTVNVNDLLAVINGWGQCSGPPCGAVCTGDVSPPFSGDCVIDVQDLLTVIEYYYL